MRTALRIDLFMKGDWHGICKALKEAGLSEDMEGAKQFLRNWADILKPEYLMASMPDDWHYPELPAQYSGLPADVPAPADKFMTTAYRKITATTLIEEVVAPICRELKLPVALK